MAESLVVFLVITVICGMLVATNYQLLAATFQPFPVGYEHMVPRCKIPFLRMETQGPRRD